MWNQLIILPILLLKTTSAYPDYDDGNVVVPCGAPGGSCHLYCQTHSKDDYDYNYNPWSKLQKCFVFLHLHTCSASKCNTVDGIVFHFFATLLRLKLLRSFL